MSQFTTILKRTSIASQAMKLTESGERLRGEWWIVNGNAQFADGDVGDMGHEAQALRSITQDLVEQLGIRDDGETILLGELSDQIEDVVEPTDDETVQEATVRWLKENGTEDAEELVGMAWDGGGDVREYMSRTAGWKRVAGNTVETYQLTDSDLSDIHSGLMDILEEEGVDDDADPEFDIWVAASQKWFQGVPYSAMSGTVAGLREYDQSFKAR